MKYILLLLPFLIVLTNCKKTEPAKLVLIPQPTEILYQEGTFKITNNTVIVAETTEEAQKLARAIQTFLQTSFDLNLEITSKAEANAIKLLQSGIASQDSYQLAVSKSGVLIQSSAYQGIFYGIQTLKQLLSPQAAIAQPTLHLMEINDAPAFQWRGMMLDVSRHFFPKDSVKKVIDILAMHKMNKFHWHLVDGIGWRIEIDQYPELTKRGAWRKVKKDRKLEKGV